jgi:Lrp/AsnC family leucine-responsive transcriptional regulator
MEGINLDLLDRKIVYQLDLNARQANSQIAKKVRASKEVVNYRIKRLEKEGYISGYHTIINFWKLGYQTIRVYLKFIDMGGDSKDELINYLVNDKSVLFVLNTEGNYDVGFGVLVKNLPEFEKFYENLKNIWKPLIAKEHVSFYTAIYHFNRDYLLENQNKELKSLVIKEEPIVPHDEKDIKLLKLLAEQARISILDLSEKLNMAPRTIAYRIKQLEKKKVIVAYRMIFNLDKIHYEHYKLDITTRENSIIPKIISFCNKNPNITFIVRTIGGADLECGVEVLHRESLDQLMDEIRKSFEGIREITSTNLRGYKKYVYFIK